MLCVVHVTLHLQDNNVRWLLCMIPVSSLPVTMQGDIFVTCCVWLPQGIYMLQDNNFRWLLRVAPAAAPTDGSSPSEQLAAAAAPYLELPRGIIRGTCCAIFFLSASWFCDANTLAVLVIKLV